MKVKVLGWILIATLGMAVLDYMNLLGTKKIIQVNAHYMQYTCGKDNVDMRVTAVSDSAFTYLIGEVISPELLNFKNAELAQFVSDKVAPFRSGDAQTLADFTLVGYVRRSSRHHCSSSICFKVERLKYSGDSTFVTF